VVLDAALGPRLRAQAGEWSVCRQMVGVRPVVALLLAVLSTGCRSHKPIVDVRQQFTAEARAQGLEVRRSLPDGRVIVALGEREVTVSLENLSRDLSQGAGAPRLKEFVGTVRQTLTSTASELPAWEEARSRLRFSLEPEDTELGDTVRRAFAGRAQRVLVYLSPDQRQIRFVTPADLKHWNVDQAAAEHIASASMDALLRRTALKTEDIQGSKLAYFDFASPFKAALITSPALKAALKPKLGWPLYAVVPCRDFAYVFHDQALLERMGAVVLREHQQSSYPITTEVLELSDQGVRAIGDYAHH
jgi:hypothetical protein